MILQIHDELLIEVHKDELDYISSMVIEKMETALKLDVPLKIDYGTGKSWFEAH